MKLLVILLLLIGSTLTNDDKAGLAYQSIINKYNKAKSLFVSFDMLFYNNSKLITDQIKGCKVIKESEKYFVKIGDNEVILVKPYTINIDREEKIIYVDNYIAVPSILNLIKIDDLIKNYKIKLVQETSNRHYLDFNIKDGELKKMRIYFNPINFEIIKYVADYSILNEYGIDEYENHKLEIVYGNQKISLTNESNYSELNLNQYINKKNGVLSLTEKFKSFKLKDNTKSDQNKKTRK